MRGMVVGEGGRSSGVLLYCIYSSSSPSSYSHFFVGSMYDDILYASIIWAIPAETAGNGKDNV